MICLMICATMGMETTDLPAPEDRDHELVVCVLWVWSVWWSVLWWEWKPRIYLPQKIRDHELVVVCVLWATFSPHVKKRLGEPGSMARRWDLPSCIPSRELVPRERVDSRTCPSAAQVMICTPISNPPFKNKAPRFRNKTRQNETKRNRQHKRTGKLAGGGKNNNHRNWTNRTPLTNIHQTNKNKTSKNRQTSKHTSAQTHTNKRPRQ